MTALDVFISLCLVAFLACVSVAVIKFLEDAKLLTINKYLAMIASWFFWWSCVAIAGLSTIAHSMATGIVARVMLLNFDWWAFTASTLVYFLTFCYVMTHRKKTHLK
jgi:hypothetical protein